MLKITQEKFSTTLQAHLKHRPGLPIASIPTILGWDVSPTSLNRVMEMLLNLEELGEIKIEPESTIYPYKRVFAGDGKPKLETPDRPQSSLQKRVAVTIASQNQRAIAQQQARYRTELGKLIDAGELFSLKDLAIAAGQHPGTLLNSENYAEIKAEALQAIAQIRAKEKDTLNVALDRLLKIGQPFNLTDLSREAGLGEMVIFAGRHKDFKQHADTMIALTGRRKPEHSTIRENRDRLVAALEDLRASGETFTYEGWAAIAGVSLSTLHNGPYDDLRKDAEKHLATLKFFAIESEENKALQRRLEELEQSNRELRKQISQQIQPIATPQSWLLEQISTWRDRERHLLEELEQIKQDLSAVQSNLGACQHLLALENFTPTPNPCKK
jgi:hypothetical protein